MSIVEGVGKIAVHMKTNCYSEIYSIYFKYIAKSVEQCAAFTRSLCINSLTQST